MANGLGQVRPIPLFSTIRAHFVPLVVGSELGLHSREALQGSTEPTALWTPQVTSEPQALWSALVRTTLQPLVRARSGSELPNALGRSAMTAAFRGITTVRGAALWEFLLGGGRGQLAPKGPVMGEPRGKKAERTARAAALAAALARSGVTVPPLAVRLPRTRRRGQPREESCRSCPQPRRMVYLNIRFPVRAIDDRAKKAVAACMAPLLQSSPLSLPPCHRHRPRVAPSGPHAARAELRPVAARAAGCEQDGRLCAARWGSLAGGSRRMPPRAAARGRDGNSWKVPRGATRVGPNEHRSIGSVAALLASPRMYSSFAIVENSTKGTGATHHPVGYTSDRPAVAEGGAAARPSPPPHSSRSFKRFQKV